MKMDETAISLATVGGIHIRKSVAATAGKLLNREPCRRGLPKNPSAVRLVWCAFFYIINERTFCVNAILKLF
jgi:hypothetical protein